MSYYQEYDIRYQTSIYRACYNHFGRNVVAAHENTQTL